MDTGRGGDADMDEQGHVRDLVAAYVLGAVTPAEASLVEEHLAVCPLCRRLEGELYEVETALPELAGEMRPPPMLKARIMAVVESEASQRGLNGTTGLRALPAPAPTPARELPRRDAAASRDESGMPLPTPLPSRRMGRMGRLYPLLAIAAVLALVVGVGVWRVLNVGQPPARAYALAGTGSYRSINGTLTYDRSSKRLVLDVRGLKPIGPNQVYELWLIHGQSVRGFRGFRPRAGGRGHYALAGQDVPAHTTVALTIERAPMVAAPTMQPIAAASISS